MKIGDESLKKREFSRKLLEGIIPGQISLSLSLSLFCNNLQFYIIRILQFYIYINYILTEYKNGKQNFCRQLSFPSKEHFLYV